jgi:hypothetical protein
MLNVHNEESGGNSVMLGKRQIIVMHRFLGKNNEYKYLCRLGDQLKEVNNEKMLVTAIGKNPDCFNVEVRSGKIVKTDARFMKTLNVAQHNREVARLWAEIVASGKDILNLTDLSTLPELVRYAKEVWGVQGGVFLHGLDPVAIKATFVQMERVISDFSFLSGSIHQFSKRDADIMGYVPTKDMLSGIITFHRGHYRRLKDIEEIYNAELKTNGVPKGTEYAHAGVHELGHGVILYIVQQNYPYDKWKEIWNTRSEAKSIVDEAVSIVEKDATMLRTLEGYIDVFVDMTDDDVVEFFNTLLSVEERRDAMVRAISTYATRTDTKGNNIDDEVIGEAFADYYANGEEKANVLSKVIMERVRRRVE